MNIFNYFKVNRTPEVKTKSEQEVIKEIHDSVDQAQEKLLTEALKIINNIENKSHELDKAERLEALGFLNSKGVIEGKKLKEELVTSQEDAELVQYYKRTYPFLKFLKVSQLEAICDKYGLIYASVDRYKEDVPERNISEIENVQPLRPEDMAKDNYFLRVNDVWAEVPSDLSNILTKGFYVDKYFNSTDFHILSYAKSHGGYKGSYNGYTTGTSSNAAILSEEKLNNRMYIAAPKKHFDLEGIKNNTGVAYLDVKETEISDPVVFRFVRGGVQVLTKWGLEAEDPELQVDIMN